MQLFQQALTMWKPFAAGMAGTPMGMPNVQPPKATSSESDEAKDAQVTELRRQMEAMQKQLDAMSRKS